MFQQNSGFKKFPKFPLKKTSVGVVSLKKARSQLPSWTVVKFSEKLF